MAREGTQSSMRHRSARRVNMFLDEQRKVRPRKWPARPGQFDKMVLVRFRSGKAVVSYEDLVRVLVGPLGDYFSLPFVTEHHFRLYRAEGGLRVYRTRFRYVRTAAHLVAHLGRFSFPGYPPEEEQVWAALRQFRPEIVDGRDLLTSFRARAEGYGIADEDLDAVFRSVGEVREAVRLVDEWNDRRAVCRTDTEFVYLEWFTNA